MSEIAARRFDMVLSDLHLGNGPSGLEVFKNRPVHCLRTPFVLMTGYASIDACKDAIRSGVADFFEKPVVARQLLAALDRILGSNDAITAECSADAIPSLHSGDNRHVRCATELINQRFTDPDFGVAELADGIDISREHLARLFRLHLNKRPLEVIHRKRIANAELLLRDSGLSIYSVAVDSGYRCTKDLDLWFHQFHGMTPTEWRAVGERMSRDATEQ